MDGKNENRVIHYNIKENMPSDSSPKASLQKPRHPIDPNKKVLNMKQYGVMPPPLFNSDILDAEVPMPQQAA